MDHLEISAKGGKATFRKYGKKHYRKLGLLSADVKLKKYGTDFYLNLSRLGVEARKKKANAKKSLGQKIVDAVVSI